jgi:ribosome maturation factor RimP
VTSSDRVRALLDPVVDGAGLVLEDVTVTPAGRRRVLRVVVDLPEDAEGGLDLDTVAGVSRAVSDALDTSEVLGGGPYVLEVSSPGVDRPLTERRHWSRARGRLVVAQVEKGNSPSEVTGRIVSVGEDGVELATGAGVETLPWSTMLRGRVQVEFTRPVVDDEPVVDDDEED